MLCRERLQFLTHCLNEKVSEEEIEQMYEKLKNPFIKDFIATGKADELLNELLCYKSNDEQMMHILRSTFEKYPQGNRYDIAVVMYELTKKEAKLVNRACADVLPFAEKIYDRNAPIYYYR